MVLVSDGLMFFLWVVDRMLRLAGTASELIDTRGSFLSVVACRAGSADGVGIRALACRCFS